MSATQEQVLSVIIEKPGITQKEINDLYGGKGKANPQIRSLLRYKFIGRKPVPTKQTWALYVTEDGLEYFFGIPARTTMI